MKSSESATWRPLGKHLAHMPEFSPSSFVALTGNPNCGKTTLFNALTGLRAKVGNYAGVTVVKGSVLNGA